MKDQRTDRVYDELDRVEMLYKFQNPIDNRLHDTSAVVNWVDNRIEGMHLALPGKGNALGQLNKNGYTYHNNQVEKICSFTKILAETRISLPGCIIIITLLNIYILFF